MSVSDDVVQRFARLAIPTLANALDDVAFEGVLAGLTQMVPGTRCAGRAITVRVRPGDVFVADGSGVVCIPAAHTAKVAELAESYAKDDVQAAAELGKGLSLSSAMAKFLRI